ncbi:MAG: patatin family protein [Clostridia bacterium]|nr:patatin family protein [Clostridia bacterium]
MKKGLIMEGGAMRGMFTAGVIDVFMENKITFDGAIGVSAGAAFGCNLKSGQIGRAIRYNVDYCKDKRYCSMWSLLTTGDMYGADFCYHQLPEKLDVFDTKAYNENPMEFYVVCTDVLTGNPVYKNLSTTEDGYLEWIRASASMPLVSRVVKIGDYEMLDGGISDSIPLKYFESAGYDKNVVILTQPKSYVKQTNGMMPAMKLFMRRYPMMIKAMEKRHIVYNETVKYICEKEKKGEVFVIRPEDTLPLKRVEHNEDKLKETYKIGRKTAEKQLKSLVSFLEGE